jgi:hypothetical protein
MKSVHVVYLTCPGIVHTPYGNIEVMDWMLDNGAGVSSGSGAHKSATDENEVATDWMENQMAKSGVPI